MELWMIGLAPGELVVGLFFSYFRNIYFYKHKGPGDLVLP